MAKQRGIHQISGKINNLCYYQQKYISGGLIRRINEAMSERLKFDPVFSNTRVANTIFGACSAFAGGLLSFFGSRSSFLFKPYRQSLLTRAIKNHLLKYQIDSIYPGIGDRIKSSNSLSIIIDGIVKNKIISDFPELPRRLVDLPIGSTQEFSFSYDSLSRFCFKNKCIGVQITITSPCAIYTSFYNEESESYDPVDVRCGGRGSYNNWYLQDEDGGFDISVNVGDIDDAITFWIIYAIPILSKFQDRPILGETGAACGIITTYLI